MVSDSHYTEELDTQIRTFQSLIEDYRPEPWLDMPILIPRENKCTECGKEEHKT
jgi:hypothetical protein